jgi:hypothetical protein
VSPCYSNQSSRATILSNYFTPSRSSNSILSSPTPPPACLPPLLSLVDPHRARPGDRTPRRHRIEDEDRHHHWSPCNHRLETAQALVMEAETAAAYLGVEMRLRELLLFPQVQCRRPRSGSARGTRPRHGSASWRSARAASVGRSERAPKLARCRGQPPCYGRRGVAPSGGTGVAAKG